jgi:hypothetical protein
MQPIWRGPLHYVQNVSHIWSKLLNLTGILPAGFSLLSEAVNSGWLAVVSLKHCQELGDCQNLTDLLCQA